MYFVEMTATATVTATVTMMLEFEKIGDFKLHGFGCKKSPWRRSEALREGLHFRRVAAKLCLERSG